MNGGTAFIWRALHNPEVIASYVPICEFQSNSSKQVSVCVYYFDESFKSFLDCVKFLKNIFSSSVGLGICVCRRL